MPIGLTSNAAEASNGSSANASSTTTSFTATLAGDIVFAVVAWGNTTAGSANTGDVTSISDTQTNTWTRVGSTVYTTAVTAGHYGLAIFYALLKNTVSPTITVNISNGPYSEVRLSTFGYTNAVGSIIDTTSTAKTGNGTAITTNGFTPIYAADEMILIGTSNTANTLPAGTNFAQRLTGSNSIFSQDFDPNGGSTLLFLGQGTSTLTAPFNFSGTLSGTADWVTILVGVETPAPAGLAMGDTVEASGGNFRPFQQLYFAGSMFLGLYNGLTFMKNVYVLPRDYWLKSLSTPYSGQLFPTGGTNGSTGQVFPF